MHEQLACALLCDHCCATTAVRPLLCDHCHPNCCHTTPPASTATLTCHLHCLSSQPAQPASQHLSTTPPASHPLQGQQQGSGEQGLLPRSRTAMPHIQGLLPRRLHAPAGQGDADAVCQLPWRLALGRRLRPVHHPAVPSRHAAAAGSLRGRRWQHLLLRSSWWWRNC
jgi:hypothetical protein